MLHRLYPLYGFDVLRDSVFDAMHLLPLNVVKNNIERWISKDYFAKKDLDNNLAKMPWTTGTVHVNEIIQNINKYSDC